jgi:regulatory protein
MSARKPRRPAPPLNERTLRELAIAYVGRYATSRAKLRSYLERKLRERGWDGPGEPGTEALADDLARRGYIDDAGYALAKARALSSRGYGKRRVVDKLRSAGIEEADGAAAREHSDSEALAAALRFAERRRLGPFAAVPLTDPKERGKAMAAMVRAGHGFDVARAIIAMPPGSAIDLDELKDRARLTSV